MPMLYALLVLFVAMLITTITSLYHLIIVIHSNKLKDTIK